MSGNRYLLDTNVFINAIHQKLKLPAAGYTFSVITELELLGYPELSTTDETALKAVLNQLTRIDLDERVRTEAIQIRRASQMKLPDSIISASAIVTETTLVTDDIKLAQRHSGSVVSLDDLLSLS